MHVLRLVVVLHEQRHVVLIIDVACLWVPSHREEGVDLLGSEGSASGGQQLLQVLRGDVAHVVAVDGAEGVQQQITYQCSPAA